MHEIKCPNCGTVFKIDETSYADILSQVRGQEFDKALEERLHLFEKEKTDAIRLAETSLEIKLQKNLSEREAQIAKLSAEKEAQIAKLSAESESKITKLSAEIDKSKTEQKLAVTEAVAKLEKERDDAKNELRAKEYKSKLLESSLKDKYESALKLKDEQIDRLKDLKAKLSTKMVGETLEQHCENEFNKLRATGFKHAYFEKDNDARTGSKGDFIFRDYDEHGTEIVSIMFEMKNENDETSTKHKNEDFLKELDKDRKEKNCEYAVLVSLLESENEFYNTGIVDMTKCTSSALNFSSQSSPYFATPPLILSASNKNSFQSKIKI